MTVRAPSDGTPVPPSLTADASIAPPTAAASPDVDYFLRTTPPPAPTTLITTRRGVFDSSFDARDSAVSRDEILGINFELNWEDAFGPRAIRLKDAKGKSHVVIIETMGQAEALEILRAQRYPENRLKEHIMGPEKRDSFLREVTLARSLTGEVLGYAVIGYTNPDDPGPLTFFRNHKKDQSSSSQMQGLGLALTAYRLARFKPHWGKLEPHEAVASGLKEQVLVDFRRRFHSPVDDKDSGFWKRVCPRTWIPRMEADFILSLVSFTNIRELFPVGGVSGASGQPPHVSPALEDAVRPPQVRALVPPPDSPAVLDEAKLSAILARAQNLDRVIRFSDVGDHFEWMINDEGEGSWAVKEAGMHTWGDLKNFIELALGQSKLPVDIEIDQYNFPSLQPTPEFLSEVQTLALQSGKRVNLSVRGDPMDPPTVYWFDQIGIHSSLLETDKDAIQYWQNYIGSFLVERDQVHLMQALREVDKASPGVLLGDYLERVIESYNKRSSTPIELNRRTEIFERLEKLRTYISKQAQHFEIAKSHITPGVMAWNPVDTLLRQHPANTAPGNCWYSVGAGQMVSVFELTRKLIDQGTLPLDFRLLADNLPDGGQYDSMWELNTLGTRRVFLGDQPVNPKGRKAIYVLNDKQRHEALLKYQPQVIFFNLKGGVIPYVLTDDFLKVLAALKEKPVLITPVKSYSKSGSIIYLDVYAKLAAVDPELARRFVIMGGFFAAPQILKGEKIFVTLAADGEEGLKIVARGLSPTAIDPETNRANWKAMDLKLIPSKELAAALNAGGANKNFLTYRSARLLMRQVLEAPKVTDEIMALLEQKLEAEKRGNIALGEEITARLAASYGISTDQFESPDGLVQDFWYCLPKDTKQLFEIKSRLAEIIRDKNLKGLPALIEEIRNKLGGGTRNARDGYIDEVLLYSFQALQGAPGLEETFEDFYTHYYPKKWTGPNGAQEGRNGIGPVVAYAKAHNITLPLEVYESLNSYLFKNRETFPGEQKRETKTPAVVEPWGLSHLHVRHMRRVLRLINQQIDASQDEVNQEIMLKRFEALYSVLQQIEEGEGIYPEVSRRILVIRDQIKKLIAILKAATLSPERKTAAIAEFNSAVKLFMIVFYAPDTNTTQLLSGLRYAAKKLHDVELAINKELKRKLYDVAADAAETPLAKILAGHTEMDPTGRFPLISRESFETFRDTVPHLFQEALALWDELEKVKSKNESVLNGVKAVKTMIKTAAVTAPTDLWIVRQVLSTFKKRGIADHFASGTEIIAENYASAHDLDLAQFTSDLELLASRGYLKKMEDGGYIAAAYADSLWNEITVLDPNYQTDMAQEMVKWFNGEINEEWEGWMNGWFDQRVRKQGKQEKWTANLTQMDLGYYLVPLVLALKASKLVQEPKKGEGVTDDPRLIPEMRKVLEEAGLIRENKFTALGERVFKHGYGPFGIIYAYHPYLNQHEGLLTSSQTTKPKVARATNIVGSKYGNLESFKLLVNALADFQKETGFVFTKVVEHAVAYGVATQELVKKLGEKGIKGIEFYAADLEEVALDGARSEQAAGRLPQNMQFLTSDIGDPEKLITFLGGAEAARGTVMMVGAGFHEIRGKTDDEMVKIFQKYREAGIILVFVESTDYTTEQIRDSAWQSYHGGFRWVHQTSGQRLRAPWRIKATDRLSWSEIATHAGYELNEKYSPGKRLLYPVPMAVHKNPPLEKIFFCTPKDLKGPKTPGPLTTGSSLAEAALEEGGVTLVLDDSEPSAQPKKKTAPATQRAVGRGLWARTTDLGVRTGSANLIRGRVL